MTTETQEELQDFWNKLDGDESPAPLVATPTEAPEPPQDLTDKIAGLEAQLGTALQHIQRLDGRFGGLHSHIKKIDGELKTTRGTDVPSTETLKQAKGSPEAMAKLKEEYPAFYDVLAPVITPLMEKEEQRPVELPQNLVTMEQLDERDINRAIETSHKGWTQTVQTPQFHGWFARQAPEVQALAHIPGVDPAVRLLDLYKGTTKTEHDQLNSAAALPRGGGKGGPVTKSLNDMTDEEYWKYLDEQDRQKAARQR